MENVEGYKLKPWNLFKPQLAEIASTFHNNRRFVFSDKDLHDVNQILVDKKIGNFIATWDPKNPIIEAIEARALEMSDPNTLDLRMKRIEDMLETLIQRTETTEFGLSENEVKLTSTKEENAILEVATSRAVADKPIYSIEEAAAFKCVKPGQVRSAIRCGTLKAVPQAKYSRVRVTKESLIAWRPLGHNKKNYKQMMEVAVNKTNIRGATISLIDAAARFNVKEGLLRNAYRRQVIKGVKVEGQVILKLDSADAWFARYKPRSSKIKNVITADDTVAGDIIRMIGEQIFPESIPSPVYERPVFTPIGAPMVIDERPTLKIGVLGNRGKNWFKPDLNFGKHEITYLDCDKMKQLDGNFDFIVLTRFHNHKASNKFKNTPICRINTGNGIFTQVRTPNQLKNWLALHEKDMAN
jgi:hypothetical protein